MILSRFLGPLALAALPASAQTVWYVNDDASGADDGSSWQDAYRALPDAFDVAQPGDEVWVAEGTYYGTKTGDRKEHLAVVCDVYGGFIGTESDPSQRAGSFDLTIVTGDWLGDDGPDFSNRQDNSRRLVHLQGPVLLDGLTLRGMERGEKTSPFSTGDVTVRNCRFLDNRGKSGGACLLEAGIVQFADCRFEGNRATGDSGTFHGGTAAVTCRGCEFLGNESSGSGGASTGIAEYEDCTFRGNRAWRGGALSTFFTDSNTSHRNVVRGSVFEDNRSTTAGGAVFGRSLIEGCTFRDNEAPRGGAVDGPQLTIRSSRFVRNRATEGGAVSAWPSIHPDPLVRVEDSAFEDNEAELGGALRGWKGDYTDGMELEIVGCAFRGNQASTGGALELQAAVSSATIVQCRFEENAATADGGALASGMPCLVRGSVFVGNASGGAGGAARLAGGSAAGRIVLSRFLGNVAETGGGVWVGGGWAQVELLGCEFGGNRADGAAGGGGLWLDAGLVGPTRVVNCTIVANTALGSTGGGGGMVGNPLAVANSIFWDNRDAAGSGFEAQVVDNDTDDGRFPLIHCAIQGWDGSWTKGAGNHGGDPLFLDADGADDIAGTADDDLRLGAGSACIDVARRAEYVLADASGWEPGPPTDLGGGPRFVDALDCGEAPPPDGILDVGAHERSTVDGQNVLCEGAPSSLGVAAELAAPCGISLAAGAFTLRAAPVPPQDGVFLASAGWASTPFGDGVLCLKPPLVRLGAAAAVGGALELVVDPGAPPIGGLWGAGTTWYLQVLYRDPAAGGAGFNLSSATTLLVWP